MLWSQTLDIGDGGFPWFGAWRFCRWGFRLGIHLLFLFLLFLFSTFPFQVSLLTSFFPFESQCLHAVQGFQHLQDWFKARQTTLQFLFCASFQHFMQFFGVRPANRVAGFRPGQ